MSLNIKNPEAHALAEAIAAKTGQSLTGVVVEALREKLERLKAPIDRKRYNEMLRIANECAAHLSDEVRAIDHGELLYDEDGLPK